MAALNFKHLRYFWMVAKTGSIARAAEQLHLTPHSISGQLREFEASLGVELFRRVGRKLETTDAGRSIVSYAEEIFTVADELQKVLRGQQTRKFLPFRVGIADSVSKSVAYRLVEPALKLEVSTTRLSRGAPSVTAGRPVDSSAGPDHRRSADADQSERARLQPPAGRERIDRVRHSSPGKEIIRQLSHHARQRPISTPGRRRRYSTETASMA